MKKLFPKVRYAYDYHEFGDMLDRYRQRGFRVKYHEIDIIDGYAAIFYYTKNMTFRRIKQQLEKKNVK